MVTVEQRENLLDLGFSIILLVLSLDSVYSFTNGAWFSIIPNYGIGILMVFLIGIGTVFGVIFGLVFTVMSIYSLNEAFDSSSPSSSKQKEATQ